MLKINIIGVGHILLGAKPVWMEEKLNHSLLCDSSPVQKLKSLSLESKGASFSTSAKCGEWDDFF